MLDREYPRRNKLDCMVDANLGADAHSEHSRSCYVIMLNGGVIKMKILQTRVSRSTGHAECQALVLLTQSIQLCRDMLTELGYSQGSVRICEDNAAVTMQVAATVKEREVATTGVIKRPSMRSLTQERYLWIKYLAQRIPVM